MTHPEIIAHRGYSAVAPENTLAALTAALEAGATSIEVDVQTAIDGTPVLIHDPHLGRTTSGVGPVRRRTVGQLQSLDAGGWFSDEFEGERIPTLAESLEHLGGDVERFYAEVKGYREMEDLDRMASIVRSAGLLARTTFISMDPIVLDRIRHTEPSAALGYVVDEIDAVERAVEWCREDGNAFLDLKLEIALDRPDTVAGALGQDVEVGVWTVDRPEEAESLWDRGVTRFTSNEVEALLKWSRSVGSPT
ncbi:MAG: glycerophosphodiester phosphodiesterase [Gemmatimonadota bacterium]